MAGSLSSDGNMFERVESPAEIADSITAAAKGIYTMIDDGHDADRLVSAVKQLFDKIIGLDQLDMLAPVAYSQLRDIAQKMCHKIDHRHRELSDMCEASPLAKKFLSTIDSMIAERPEAAEARLQYLQQTEARLYAASLECKKAFGNIVHGSKSSD